jgi:hypothetical protein
MKLARARTARRQVPVPVPPLNDPASHVPARTGTNKAIDARCKLSHSRALRACAPFDNDKEAAMKTQDLAPLPAFAA